ncbi:MAG: hypothetical protein IJ719_05950 [Clostridia bacterium]|nr:hypothetical protein [Clostridia bacterium]
MSITRAYNRRTGVYYAYDVQYVWNEEAQKKLPVRKCIGKFDPVTNEIIPNGKRGPKPVKDYSTPKVNELDGNSSKKDEGQAVYTSSEVASAVSEGLKEVSDRLLEIANYLKTLSPSISETESGSTSSQ